MSTFTIIEDTDNSGDYYVKLPTGASTYTYIPVVAIGTTNEYKVDVANWPTTPPTDIPNQSTVLSGTLSSSSAQVFEGVGRIVSFTTVAAAQSAIPQVSSMGEYFVHLNDYGYIDVYAAGLNDNGNGAGDDDFYALSGSTGRWFAA